MSETRLSNYTDGQVVEAPASVVLGTSDFTLLTEAFPTSRRYGMVFSKDRSCVSANQFRFEIHASGYVVVMGLGCDGHGAYPLTQDPNGYGSDLHTPAPLPLNTWSSLALVRNKTSLILYLNGAEVSRFETKTVVDHQNPALLRLGSRFPPTQGSSAENPFPGKLSNASFVPRALSASEVAAASWSSALDNLLGRDLIIRCKESSLYIEVKDASKDSGAILIQDKTFTKAAHQVFRLVKNADDGTYTVLSKNSGLVIEAQGSKLDDCVSLVQNGLNGHDNQRLNFQHNFDDGTWSLYYKHSGKVWDRRGGGIDLIQYHYHGGNNQRWFIEDASLFAYCGGPGDNGGAVTTITGPVISISPEQSSKLVSAQLIGLPVTCSSYYDPNHGPRSSRLDVKDRSNVAAWCTALCDSNQWIQVQSQTLRKWRKVVTQGRASLGQGNQWVTKYKVQYSTDGKSWAFANDGGEFTGNSDPDTHVEYVFKTPFVARFVRLVPTAWTGWISLRFDLFYEAELDKLPAVAPAVVRGRLLPGISGLGFFTWASSVLDVQNLEERALLNFTAKEGSSAWSALRAATTEFFQVSSQKVQRWVAIETQGSGTDAWVTSYKVEYTLDGVTWSEADNGKVYQANKDNNSIVKVVFDKPFFARAIKIRPVSWNVRISLRVEVYVEEEALVVSPPSNTSSSGLQTGAIETGATVISSSIYTYSSGVDRVRLDWKGRENSNAWQPATASSQEWLQVSTGGYVRRWTAIETQGRDEGAASWVTSYMVRYTLDGLVWHLVDDGRVFQGNTDASTKVKQTFNNPFYAVSVRFVPLTWNAFVATRLEFYYELVDVPVQPVTVNPTRVTGGGGGQTNSGGSVTTGGSTTTTTITTTTTQKEYHSVLYVYEGRTWALTLKIDGSLTFEVFDELDVSQQFLLCGTGGSFKGGYTIVEPRSTVNLPVPRQVRIECLLVLLVAINIPNPDLSKLEFRPTPKSAVLTVVNSTGQDITLYRVLEGGSGKVLTIVLSGLTVAVSPVCLGSKIRAVSSLNKIWEFVVDELEEFWTLTDEGWSGSVGHVLEEHNAGLLLVGQWIGDYQGCADNEIIEVVRKGNQFIATKLRGDNNVPTGQISWRVTIDNEQSLVFQGEGQVAQPGFVGAQFVPGKLTIISNTQIAFWWSTWATVNYRRYFVNSSTNTTTTTTTTTITSGGSCISVCPGRPDIVTPVVVPSLPPAVCPTTTPTTPPVWGSDLVGLWIGNYCGCGEEVVEIKLVGHELVCTKITGDNYVPAGEVTWKVTMTSALSGSGQGQLAYPGHRNPYWLKGALAVKDANHLTFGGGCGCWPLVPYRRKC